jgi:anhydro-N-acetylmuramic acid kinase
MSGSSLDGLDVVLCRFGYQPPPDYRLLSWAIEAGTTLPYPGPWRARLRTAPHLPANELWRLHADLGKYFGREVGKWLRQQECSADLIGSHGHTIFHDPKRGFTTQIGDGAQLAAAAGIPVVTELRSTDIAAGGQGAPIAPLADLYLFPDFQAFVNLGGIANISLKTGDGLIVAGDVTGANQILDRLAAEFGEAYDDGGRRAAGGNLLPELQQALEGLSYHQAPYPKSLGNDWVTGTLWPLVKDSFGTPADKLHTFCHFLAQKIHADLNAGCEKSGLVPQPLRVMCTGGGAHNDFLIRCLRELPQNERFPLGYEVPAPETVNLKEAALIALAALHRELGIPNAFASATGAKRDTVNGALYLA